MAVARLREVPTRGRGGKGERWFYVEAFPFGAHPWIGPSERSWDDVEVIAGNELSYTWRTRADEVRELAALVVSGGPAAGSAVTTDPLAGFLQEQVNLRSEVGDGREDVSAILRQVCQETADGTTDPADYDRPWSAYSFEADAHLADAARALAPLPLWARLKFADEGGPGSGYRQPVLILDGHGIEDLAAHLNALLTEVR